MTWDNATTTDGEWHGLSLVIDTDTYAGNIEREMLAACTGVVINEPTVILEEIASEYDGPDLRHLVTGDAEAYVTPGWSIAAGGERHRVSPEHPFRMPTLSSVHIPLRAEPADDVLDGIKRRALAFAAAGVVDADGYVRIAPFRITGFRMIRERVTTQSRDLGGAP